MALDIWKIKPLEHSKEIGGVWVACEWAEDLDGLVYDIDDNRYRIVAGATHEETVEQVIDNYLDRAPFGSPHKASVRSLVESALPGRVVAQDPAAIADKAKRAASNASEDKPAEAHEKHL